MPVPATTPPPALRGAIERPEEVGDSQFKVKSVFAAFVFMFTATQFDRYTLDGKVGDKELKGEYWLPSPVKVLLVEGAGNITSRTKGGSERTMYRDRETDGVREHEEVWLDAQTVVEAAYLPEGVEPGPYRRRYTVRVAGSDALYAHYEEAWNIPSEVVKGSPVEWTFDRNKRALWVASLVMAGKVPAVPEALIRRRVARTAKRLNRVQTLPIPDDVRKLRIAETKALIGAEKGAVRLAA